MNQPTLTPAAGRCRLRPHPAPDAVNLTIQDAMARFGVGRTTLYRLQKAGKITIRKLGRNSLVDAASAERFFRSLPEQKVAA